MKRLLYILFIVIVSLPVSASREMDSLFLNAVYNRDFEAMSRYVEQGVDLNARWTGYADIMQYYATNNDINGVQWCINHHMDVNKQDSLNATALMHAAINGHSAICKLLIENGADTHVRSSYGMTAAEYALRNCFTALSEYINNPSLPVPHDFYDYRRKIATILRSADYKKAKELGEEAIHYAHKELAPQSRYNVYLLLDIAGIYMLEGDVESQNQLLEKACELAHQNVPMTEIYFRAKISQCFARFLQGQATGMADSLIYYNSYSDEIFGTETKWLSFTAVALSAAKEGYVKEARTILYQALDYAISLANDDYEFYSDYIINTLSNILDLAVQADGSEALKEAEMCEYYLRAYIHNRHDYVTAIAKSRIGHYYRAIGQYGYSTKWYIRANEDLAKTVGIGHGFYAQNLLNIGIVNIAMGHVDSALVYLYQTKEILKRNQDYDSYSGAITDISIGTCLTIQHMVNPDKCALSQEIEGLYLYALERLNRAIPSPDMNVAMCKSNLALYYSFIEEYNKAHKYATDATEIAERLLGKVNQTYLNISLNNIIIEGKGQNKDNLICHISDFIKVATDLVHEQFLLLSEDSRKELWRNIYDSYFHRLLPSAIYESIEEYPALSIDLYNCALFSKGIILHTSSEIQSRLRDMQDQEIDMYLDAIINTKRKINEYEQANPGEYTEEWGQLVRDVEGMEKMALTLGRKYQNTLFLDNTSWKDIQERLLNNQVAVEVLKFEPDGLFAKTNSIRYVATIITFNSENPQYVYLCEESELSSLLNESNKDNIYSYEKNGQQLSKLIWDKLIPYIGDAHTIYFSPDGLLCQLAVEALPLSKDSAYGDAYDIVRCSSTKYILQQQKDERPTQVDLFGGIQYDMTPNEMTNQSNAFAMHSAYRGEMPDSLTRGHYEELLGAKAEVNNIARLLNNANIKSSLFTGSNATEEEFKALSGTHPNVLHIATHGFFWPYEEAMRKDYFMASLIANNKTSRYVSSMERSGLLFAGANVAMTGHRDELPSNVEDGVLSAQEISTMDLYGTDLVVLSACETGQGDIESDGVYGLQRAFKLAGVQTIIMSLWKVNDAATQMLMTEFYTNWITNKMCKRKAFETAKQKVRVNYPEPSCWAGFIMLD